MSMTREAFFAARDRKRFIDDHHHLISPWAYSADEIKKLDAILLRRNWNIPKPLDSGKDLVRPAGVTGRNTWLD